MNDNSVTYKVEYHTENYYENPVKNAHWQLQVLPQNNQKQSRLEYKLKSNLEIDQYITQHLYSGDCLSIHVSSFIKKFDLSVESKVTVGTMNPFDFEMHSIEEEKAHLSDHTFKIDNAVFLYNRQLTNISKERASEFPFWEQENLIEYCQSLMKALNLTIKFTSGETEVTTTAEEALSVGKGVCQDFAHIFIGLLRNQKIPARYVCGYLCQGKDYNGASQLHAWIECFIPGTGWIGLDPSNNLFTDHHYIKISHGRSYEDCTPIRGVLETVGSNSTSHQVKISQVQQQ